jgi:hypothetical protein
MKTIKGGLSYPGTMREPLIVRSADEITIMRRAAELGMQLARLDHARTGYHSFTYMRIVAETLDWAEGKGRSCILEHSGISRRKLEDELTLAERQRDGSDEAYRPIGAGVAQAISWLTRLEASPPVKMQPTTRWAGAA